ncbi:MAG: hypothetical protein BroJett038_35300 [Chloroflexota bacterium]|nr:MAG: hypothetical protein BroJett038_35300 [Chloroflexota bacterium]
MPVGFVGAHPILPLMVSLIPRPAQCEVLEGEGFVLGANSVIVTCECFLPEASLLAERLRCATGFNVAVTVDGSQASDGSFIELRVTKPESTHREAYNLLVSGGRARIVASAGSGAFYGCQTLLQLFPPAIFGAEPRPEINWMVPAVNIRDEPRFRWRGIMVDSARYYQPIAYLKKLIDVLSQHKFNTFHWHLTDDQGWRLEIRKYPRLTEVGSKRRESVRGHRLSELGGDGVPVGGYYTQGEVRDLVAFAARRHVQIIPEIDMPGHAQAAVAAYPELGLLTTPPEVSCQWGIHETLFNVRPATISFLQDVLAEVIELFPCRYIHIGGDEAVKRQWKEDPETQARIRELGLRDEEHLQSWFIEQMAAFLRRHGRSIVGWDEIMEGGLLSPDATVMSWRGVDGGIAAARLGHDAVMCPHESTYFDYYQCDDKKCEPLAIKGYLPLHAVYEYDPMPAGLPAEAKRHIIGVQGQLWTEYIQTTTRMDYMAFPRSSALAEVAWSPFPRPSFGDFSRRLRRHLRRLDCQDVRYRWPFE